MSELDPRIEEFLDNLKAEGSSNPNPDEWVQFYEFLISKKQLGKEDPPVPLILAADCESRAAKHWRLSEQLYWAYESGCLDDALHYLGNIPVKKWKTGSPLSGWDSDSY